MSNYTTNEIRGGMKLLIDGDPYAVIDNEYVKPGKGQAFNRIRVRNLQDRPHGREELPLRRVDRGRRRHGLGDAISLQGRRLLDLHESRELRAAPGRRSGGG